MEQMPMCLRIYQYLEIDPDRRERVKKQCCRIEEMNLIPK